ncbi:hypothetical protein NM688_g4477 [Phlebia brevispora]|uniref:Uncharacterized protein n=1 Tax=Phlebia brevispora TaxID=194682 RepID=A0ACC1T2R6_9APHY|nr:hypothetical protein NM688_g4477 [Phlebia brevispora]
MFQRQLANPANKLRLFPAASSSKTPLHLFQPTHVPRRYTIVRGTTGTLVMAWAMSTADFMHFRNLPEPRFSSDNLVLRRRQIGDQDLVAHLHHHYRTFPGDVGDNLSQSPVVRRLRQPLGREQEIVCSPFIADHDGAVLNQGGSPEDGLEARVAQHPLILVAGVRPRCSVVASAAQAFPPCPVDSHAPLALRCGHVLCRDCHDRMHGKCPTNCTRILGGPAVVELNFDYEAHSTDIDLLEEIAKVNEDNRAIHANLEQSNRRLRDQIKNLTTKTCVQDTGFHRLQATVSSLSTEVDDLQVEIRRLFLDCQREMDTIELLSQEKRNLQKEANMQDFNKRRLRSRCAHSVAEARAHRAHALNRDPPIADVIASSSAEPSGSI